MASTVKVAGLAEAAEIVGMSRTSFNMHRNRYNQEGQCPQPTAKLACGPVWIGADVTALERYATTIRRRGENKAKTRQKAADAAEKAAAKKSAAKTKSAAKKVTAEPKPAKSAAKKATAAKRVAKPAPEAEPATNVASLFGKGKSA